MSYDAQVENYITGFKDLLVQGADSQQSAVSIPNATAQMNANIMGSVVSIGAQYAMQKMSLGLGSQGATGTAGSSSYTSDLYPKNATGFQFQG